MEEDKLNELFEGVREHLQGIKALAKLHGVEDRFTMTFIGGVYLEEPSEESGTRLAAAADFVVMDEDELDELLGCAIDIYRATEKDEEHIPREIRNTDDWTSEDWIKYINKNSEDGSNS